MSAIWSDLPSGDVGLYNYNTAAMLDGVWGEVDVCNLVDDPDPNVGSAGRCLRIGLSAFNAGHARFVLPGARTVVGMSCRVWLANVPVEAARAPAPFVFCDGSNNIIICVIVTPTGSLEVRRDSKTGTLVAATAGPVITANAWTHLSCKATFGTAGNCEISIEREGINILDEDTLDFEGTTCSQVRHSNFVSPSTFITTTYIKDTYFWDGLGSQCNDHPGPVTVYRRKVVADVSSGWSRTSGASDFALLDESPPNDAGYIYADPTLPAPSIMELQDLPAEVVAIRAVFLVGRQQKSDGGDCKTQMSISPDGAAWDDGADRAITTAFTYSWDISELDPDTAAPWDPLAFNDSIIKVNRTL